MYSKAISYNPKGSSFSPFSNLNRALSTFFTLILEETVRALIGYYLLLLCARTMQWTLSPLQSLTQLAFGANGGVLNSEVYAALLLEQYGNPAMLALVVAFCVNLLLARWTRGKGVYTTGHHFLYTAMFTVFLFSSGTSLSAPVVVLLGGVLTGTWCWFSATYNRRMTQRVVGQSGVCMANSCIFASVIGLVSGKIAPDDKRYGNESDLDGFHNIPFLAFGGMLFVYLLLCLCAGTQQSRALLGDGIPLAVNCLIRSLCFAAQIYLLFQGMQMMLANLIGALWELANRFAPGHWTALDASAMLSFSPKAWRAGFVACSLGGAVSMAVLILLRAPFIPLFSLSSFYFMGGVAGIYGNACGGRRSAWLAGFLSGMVSAFLLSVMMRHCSDGTQWGASFGESEYALYGLLLQRLMKILR